MSDLIQELKQILDEETSANKNNVYVRTLSKLLKIERDSIYGNHKGNRQSYLDKVIMEEIKNYTESKK